MMSGGKCMNGKNDRIHEKKRGIGKNLIVVVIGLVFFIVVGMIVYQFVAGKMSKGQYLATVENEEGKVGYINEKGEEVIPCKYDMAYYAWTDGVTIVGEKIGEWPNGNERYKFGLINTEGEMIVPPQYDDCAIGEGYIAMAELVNINEDGEPMCNWGFLNLEGEEVTDFKYQYINASFIVRDVNGLLTVSKTTGELSEDGDMIYNYGLINEYGEEIIPLEYSDIVAYPNFGNKELFAVARRTGQEQHYGFVNCDNQEIIPFVYDSARPFSTNGLAAVSKDGKWGYIDATGETKIPFQYVSAESFSDSGLAFVEKEDGEYECINAKGETVIPNSRYQEYGRWYDAYWLEGGELAVICIEPSAGENLCGVINRTGDEIITPNSAIWVYGDDRSQPSLDLSFYGDNQHMPFTLLQSIEGNDSDDEMFQFMTSEGRVLRNTYDYAGRFSEKGWCCVGRKIGINEDGSNRYQYSYVDENEKVVLELPEKYVGASDFMSVY